MLIDDLREQHKSLQPDIDAIKAFWTNAKREERFAQLDDIASQPDFWQHKDMAAISKELTAIRNQRDTYHAIINGYQELPELFDLFAADEAELQKLATDLEQLSKNIAAFKINLLLANPQDQANCFVSVNAGAGGTESQDWASMLLRMYTRFCEREKLNAQLIDFQEGEEAGIKGATLFVTGTNAYGLLKSEHGIHRLVRISPFDASKRRHTSFAGVHVTPEMPEVEITIDPKDLRIDTYRAGGAGGQHVNKTDSAVRITHLPTNIVVQCQNERSQHQNKDVAMRMLKAKLAQKAEEERKAEAGKIEKKKIEWGSQIRSYVLHPYKMVKDHRTHFESPQPDVVLDGDIMPFIETYLVDQAQ